MKNATAHTLDRARSLHAKRASRHDYISHFCCCWFRFLFSIFSFWWVRALCNNYHYLSSKEWNVEWIYSEGGLRWQFCHLRRILLRFEVDIFVRRCGQLMPKFYITSSETVQILHFASPTLNIFLFARTKSEPTIHNNNGRARAAEHTMNENKYWAAKNTSWMRYGTGDAKC